MSQAQVPYFSICIPTHHGRREVLETLFASIAREVPPELAPRIEICVSDNASNDRTEEMLAAKAAELPFEVVYRRHADDRGGQRNILSVMELASGEYCWLVGSDDALAPGALGRVLELLRGDPSLAGILLSRASYGPELSGDVLPLPTELLPLPPDRRTRYSRFEDVLVNCGLMQGDVSLNVIARERWLDTLADCGDDPVARSPYWAHVLVLGWMAQRFPDWLWEPEVAIHSRGMNSSWIEPLGSVHDYHLTTTVDLSNVWASLAGSRHDLYRALLRKWYHGCATPSQLTHYKLQARSGPETDLRMLLGFGRHFWFMRKWWLRSVPVLLCPTPLLRRRQRQS